MQSKNYFELFGLSASFDIDLSDLAERYRGLARATHPDRFTLGSDHERLLALQTTALVNEAFQTLKDPIHRARYLLQLRGVDLGADTDTAMDPVFLTEQIELRERLEQARLDADPALSLARLAEDVGQRMRQTTDDLRAQLESGDRPEHARRLMREMQFLDKLRHQIGDVEEGLV